MSDTTKPTPEQEADLQARTIGYSDPNKTIEQREADIAAQPEQEPSLPPPPKSPGVSVFDVESHRISELFDNADVVFVREGAATHLTAYPKHEADTRFVEITKAKSSFKDHRTVTYLELNNGAKVTIDGIQVTVQPAEGPAETDGPSLNAHAPNEG